ncbi:MAG: biopolymer transporter ExbD [bacterium]
MAGDVVERQKKGGKKGLRRPKRRISIRIDMTPMVDIAFLLLIFYMVSTVFAMPQAMEINLPPIDDIDKEIEVKESNLITLRVDGEGFYWWNLKTPTPDNLPLLLPPDPNRPDTVVYQLYNDTLRGLLKEQNQQNSKLNTLVLIHRDANYADMVNILDEIDLIERSWNQYTAERLNKDIKDLTKEEKFSYRYAIGEWNPRDDKIIEAARAAVSMGGGQP